MSITDMKGPYLGHKKWPKMAQNKYMKKEISRQHIKK